MPELPKEYKAAVFESKGAPLTFKQVKLEKPKDGEVCFSVSRGLHSSRARHRELKSSGFYWKSQACSPCLYSSTSALTRYRTVRVGSTPLIYNSEREYKHKHF